MPVNVFVALCIMSIDFMIYAFFQWTYGDKRSALARQSTHKNALDEQQSHRPFLVPPQKVCPDFGE
jgi:hypothetical protein